MPWSDISPMDQRVQFITDARRGHEESPRFAVADDAIHVAGLRDQCCLRGSPRMSAHGDRRPLRLSHVEELRPPLIREFRVEVQEQLRQSVLDAVCSGHVHQLGAIDTVDDLQAHVFEAVRVGLATQPPGPIVFWYMRPITW